MNVTVVVPTYNRYKVLKRALASIYLQTYQPKEVIVIDDGSTDETPQITKDFPNIKYIYQKNAGVSSARNLGVKNAKYEWIAFLDSDDEWHEDKLQEHLDFHTNNQNIFMSYTDEKWIRNNKEVKIPIKYHKHGGEIFKECLSHCIIAPSATLIHKDLLNDIGVFDEDLEVCEDYDLWLRVSIKYEIGLIDKKLITKYGGDEDQLSMKYWGMDRFRVKALEKLLIQASSKFETLIKNELIKKYSLLLKGAKKHDKIQEINIYEKRLEDLG
ncbi:glycosyltransferase family A protein [Sulfurimonas sp.]|uniref:glycosyltransferase family 2 protein n=1 Tax=Sulfurimonas sp. TaxID=2022749 RepID=UPI002AB29594|nr:glycosyltransferase family A protein [Sulfurimonas sp.]